MSTFIFTQALDAFESQKNKLLNAYNSSIFNKDNFNNYNATWKKDKITNKLSELSIQTSTYNKVIPNIYGTNKIAGNVIWLDDVQQVVNNNTTTIKISKGQKIKQNTIEYFYFINVAIAICGNEVSELKNVWADGTLLKLSDYTYRFYKGTETQTQDSLLLSKDEKIPAYRGISYIVFENFPLSQFNNRLPNFLFEVARNDEFKYENNFIQNSTKGVCIAPTVGNFGYSISKMFKSKIPQNYEDFLQDDTYNEQLNQNNNSDISDAELSLQQLDTLLKNYEYICIRPHFFASSKNIAEAVLVPKVEFNFYDGEYEFFKGEKLWTKPYDWNIGTTWNRFNSELIDKNLYQFGTPGDLSIKEFVQKVKSKNKKIVFYPKIFFDGDNKATEKDFYGTSNDVETFFTKTNGYNAFILHYANLLKDNVDVFLIGNELSGLTKIQDENNNFVVVNQLISLAQQCRNIFNTSEANNNVKISYSAGYKEYHDYNGWYNLDSLWNSEYVDFVGIKAYFPLTYATQYEITKELIKKGWYSGEGYDYIIKNGIKKNITQDKAYKNIKYWWENVHINPDTTQTSWVAKSKNIWFTELGFSSINCCTNEPYKEYDGKGNSLLPVFSNGNVNLMSQKNAIESSLEYWKNNEYVKNIFLNSWDLRPQPFYPNKTDLWSDCENWKYNYNINNKLDINTSDNTIYQVFNDGGFNTEIIDTIQVNEFVDGLTINNNISVKDALYILQKVYFFDCVEKYNKVSFISNKNNQNNEIIEISHNELVKNKENNFLIVENDLTNTLPKKISLIYLDKDYDYDSNLVYSQKEYINSNIEAVETIPVILDKIKAQNIVDTMLNNMYLEKNVFKFSLPIKYLFLEPSDIVKLNTKDNQYILKINNTTVNNGVINIVATKFDKTIFDANTDINLNNNIEIIENIKQSNLEIFELPTINNNFLNKIYVFFALKKNNRFWNISNLYYSNNQKEFKIINQITKQSNIGSIIDLKDNGRPYYIDNVSYFKIFFDEYTDTSFMKNVDNLELLNGENIAMLGNEIIQYKNIILNADGSYTLSGLLRGLFGTKKYINQHSKNEKFIFLDSELIYQELNYDKVNTNNFYKIVNINSDITASKSLQYKVQATNLQPLKICHFKYDNNVITWQRVDRGNTNWIDNIENFSVENEEKYKIMFYDGNVLLKTINTNNRQYEIVDDDLKNKRLTIKICQVNNLFGDGVVFEKEILAK